jgi:phosphohistidine phosphatase
MKKLFLLRHAIALSAGKQGDKDRKLAPQGEMDAAALGRTMAEKKYQPSYILCSPVTRTQQTLNFLLESIGKTQTDFNNVLYESGAGDILQELQRTDDSYESVLVVGHNPSIHELAALLIDGGSPSLLARLASGGYRPCTLSVLSCNIDSWTALQSRQNELIDYMEPVDYNAPATPARWT